MYEGYLPTAYGPVEGPVDYILLPKLHQERCIVNFEDLHVTRSARTNSRNYQLSVDTAFDKVVEKCLEQHGESWLHPPIVDGFKRLFRSGGVGQVKMHSIEVTREGQLVAGELGYSVGKTYCSLSGFTAVGGSGSVQCLGLALLLHERGFDFWDLGMGMEYKVKMGAREISRVDFLRILRASRDLPGNDLSLSGLNANRLLVPRFRIGAYVRVRSTCAAHCGKVATVASYKGAHIQVRVQLPVGANESFALPADQLEDVAEAGEKLQHGEQALEDGTVVVRGLAGLPLLFRRAPGWTRCRRQRKKGGESAADKTIVEAAGVDMKVDSPEPASNAHQLSERLRGGCAEGKHTVRKGRNEAGATSRSHTTVGGGEGEEVICGRRLHHHVEWHTAALRRRQMRLFLLSVLGKRDEQNALSKRGARMLKKLRANASRQGTAAEAGGAAEVCSVKGCEQ